jgi:hypothetical protein
MTMLSRICHLVFPLSFIGYTLLKKGDVLTHSPRHALSSAVLLSAAGVLVAVDILAWFATSTSESMPRCPVIDPFRAHAELLDRLLLLLTFFRRRPDLGEVKSSLEQIRNAAYAARLLDCRSNPQDSGPLLVLHCLDCIGDQFMSTCCNWTRSPFVNGRCSSSSTEMRLLCRSRSVSARTSRTRSLRSSGVRLRPSLLTIGSYAADEVSGPTY